MFESFRPDHPLKTPACMPWTVYMLECADGTLYTGIATDVQARIGKHEKGTGAKYTRGRGPFKLVYRETFETRGCALKREAEIKAMTKKRKTQLRDAYASDS